MKTRTAPDKGDRWKPLVVCPSASLVRTLRPALAEQGFGSACILTEYPAAGTIPALLARYEANVCFLDVAASPEQALPLISEAAHEVPVVAVNPCNDADLILRCLRRGASDFLSDAAPDQVGAVLERLARLRTPEPQSSAKSGAVYAVVPGKAGCGASTLATYMAIELKRSEVGRVLLVDADFTTGSIAFLLKLKAGFHLGDAVRDSDRLDEEMWSRLAAQYQGIDVLPAPESASTRVEIGSDAAMELLSFWRKHYQAVVLDLAGAYAPGFEFAALADQVLLVTTNELAALHATRRTMECLENARVDRSRLRLVVTRYTPATGLKREAVETALKLEPYALLSNDYDAVQAAILDGKPLNPSTPLGRSIHALVEHLLGKEKAAKKRLPFFGLLPIRG